MKKQDVVDSNKLLQKGVSSMDIFKDATANVVEKAQSSFKQVQQSEKTEQIIDTAIDSTVGKVSGIVGRKLGEKAGKVTGTAAGLAMGGPITKLIVTPVTRNGKHHISTSKNISEQNQKLLKEINKFK